MRTNRHNIFLAAFMLALGAFAVPAHADVATSGDWQYDGNTIVKYLGKDASVTVPASLDGIAMTNLGEFAFQDSPNTLNITLSEGITTLDDYSLIGLNRLRSLNIPNSLKTVNSATQNTMVIENIYIHSLVAWLGIDYTGMSTIANGSNLYLINGIQPQTSVAVTEYTYDANHPLKRGAFSGIKSLNTVDLTGCTIVPEGAFSNCSNLSDVRYSEGLTTIGASAFAGIPVRSVILPESVQSIGDYAYANCRYIEQIRFGRDLSSIGTGAFSDISVNVPITAAGETPAEGGASAFASNVRTANDLFVPEASVDLYKSGWGFSHVEGCPANDSEWVVSNGYITAYTGTSGNVSIPQYVGVDYIQGFTSDVFQGNTNIQSIVFPESMDAIPENAFKGCSSLLRVTFSENLTSISASAFEDCSSLVSVSLPAGVCTIGEYAFANSGLQDFSVPESLVSIDTYAFEDCSIQQVDCSSLAQWLKIDFANPTANPGHNNARMFINGVELKILDCYNVVINNYAFYGNESLEKVILNDAISVGRGAFAGCSNLILISFNSNLIMIDRAAFDGSGTGQSLAFGDNIYSIGEFAFRKGDSEDELRSLYFGSELTYIEPWAFDGHDEITDIYISRNTPPYLCSMRGSEANYDADVFSDKVKENARLHVPDGCETDYAEKWGFNNVVGNSTGILTVKIPEGGNLSFINPSKGMRLRITPEDDDWEISSATLGETDITDAIDANGYYTLPSIVGDAVLNVIFKKKEDSSVNSIFGKKSSITLSVVGDVVTINGATPGSEVRVFNTNGQLVAESRSHILQLNATGVLILNVDGQSFKFIK